MKKRKLFALVLACVLLVTTLAACGKDKESTGGDTSDAPEKAKIVMGTEPTFPPYNYMSGTSVEGIDTDIANEIAKDMGVELEIVTMDFDSIIPSVKSGKIDFGAAGISVTEDRKKEVDFTIEYATSIQVILTTEDSPIKTVKDLDGKKVGVQLGTISDIIIGEEYPEIQLVQGKKYTDLAMDLKNGKIDAIVLDNLPAEAIKSANDGLVIVDEEFFRDSYAFVVKKDNKEMLDNINKTLQRLMDEGKIAEYTTKHLG